MSGPERPSRSVSRRAWLSGLTLTLVGVCIVLLGGGLLGIVSLNAYWQGVAANVGVAVLLIGPLLLVERAMRAQLARVDESVGEVRQESREARHDVERVAAATEATLSELSKEVRATLAKIRQQDSDLHDRAVEEVTHENLLALIRRAMDLNVLDNLGLRVALDEETLWIRARAIHRLARGEEEPAWLIELEAQRANGTTIGTASALWSPGEPAADPFVRLAEELQRAGAYPGDAAFDAGRILAALADALRRAIELRTGASGGRQVRPIVELVNDDWAITQFGLDSLRLDLWAELGELTGKADAAWERLSSDPRLAGREQQAALRDAFDRAQALHGQRRVAELAKVYSQLFRRRP